MAAVVDSLDDPAVPFGHSYGATLALGALDAGNLHRLVVTAPELVAREVSRFLSD